jgi:hypothetical protein
MGGHVYYYHYTTCAKPGQWAVMCIATITLPVQSQDNGQSCVLLPLHYLYKARTMSGHVYCYHYITCTKPGQWAVICIVTITLPVQSQENERSCVLLPLLNMYKARQMSGHVHCYHYTTCTKQGKWEVMCIVTITLPVQSQDNERHVYCYHYTTCTKPGKWPVMCIFYHYTTCTKPGQWAVMCIVTITLPVQSKVYERSCLLLPLHYLYKAR